MLSRKPKVYPEEFLTISSLKFKSEILTIESLKEKIENANIKPKPICLSLEYVFDWKGFVTPNLANPQLANHTFYNSFKFVKEDGIVKMRAKKLPQTRDDCFYPRAGIDLLKKDVVFEPVGPADFRVEEIKFDNIFAGVKKMTARLQLEE